MARPTKSNIRQNIVEILSMMKSGYGYQIYKEYRELFPKATMRSIYYNLRKGVLTKEFEIEKITKVTGEYSWGSEAEKIIYKLGEKAEPRGEDRVKAHFQQSRQ